MNKSDGVIILKKEINLTKPHIVCIIAGLCSFLWGSAFPMLKIGYNTFEIADNDTASQILFAGIRFFLAGILAVIIGSIGQKKIIIPKKNDIVPVFILCIFQTVLQYFFFYIGLANTSGVKASVIIGANVFIVMIISCLIFRTEKITARKIAGSIIGFAGIILINLQGLTEGTVTVRGEGFVLISTVAYAISSALMKKFSTRHDTFMLSSWQFIAGGAVMIAGGIIMNGSVKADSIADAGVLLYLAFLSAAAYSMWSLLLKHNNVSSVAIYGFMNPMFGFILSAIILGEKSEAFGTKGICAIILVCIGIFTVNKRKKIVEQ